MSLMREQCSSAADLAIAGDLGAVRRETTRSRSRGEGSFRQAAAQRSSLPGASECASEPGGADTMAAQAPRRFLYPLQYLRLVTHPPAGVKRRPLILHGGAAQTKMWRSQAPSERS